MNGKFKKVVSTTAAVALLASVFSGFSLTSVSAAELMMTTNYIGSKSTAETFDEGVYIDTGSNGYCDNASKTDGSWTFHWNSDGRKAFTWAGIKEVTAVNDGVSLLDYTSGNAMCLTVRGGNYPTNYMEYTLDKAVSKGTVYLSTDFGMFLEKDKSNIDDAGIEFRDSSGKVVFDVYAKGGKNYIQYTGDYNIAPMPLRTNNNQGGAHLDIQLNLDTKKAKVTFQQTGGDAVTKDKIDISDSDIASVALRTNARKSQNQYVFIDNTKFYHVGPVDAGSASAIAASDIDYGIGSWTYANEAVGGITKKAQAGVHYNGIKYTADNGQKALLINIPVKTLPADNRTIELYTGVDATDDMTNFAAANNVTIGDKTVKVYTDEKLFGEKTDNNIAGVNLAAATKIASVTFSTKDKKRYATATVGGEAEEPVEIKAGDDLTLNVATLAANGAFDDVDDLFLYSKVTDNKDGDGGSFGDMTLVYQAKQAKAFSIDSDVFNAVDKDKTVVYLGKFNTADMTNVELTGTAAKKIEKEKLTVALYATDVQKTSFTADEKVNEVKNAAEIAEGGEVKATVAAKNLGAKYLYAVVSDKNAQLASAKANYSSVEDIQSARTAQYLLENTEIDETKVFTDGTFNADYQTAFGERYSQMANLSGMAPEVFKEFAAKWAQIKAQVAGWAVVKSIDDDLKAIYTTITTNDAEADDYAVVSTDENRAKINDVNDSYKELNVTGQKFVGGQNYNVLAELVKILEGGDAAIVKKYNDAIAALWDDAANDGEGASRLTQDNYLYSGEQIKNLEDLIAEYDSYSQAVKDQIDKAKADKVIAAVKAQLQDTDGFMDVTAKQFADGFKAVKEAYEAAKDQAGKVAALKLEGMDSLYAEIKDFAHETLKAELIAKITDYTTYESYMANVDKYAKAQAYIDAVDALKKSITDNNGVTNDTYESMATAYNEAVKLKTAYDNATGSVDADEAFTKKLTDADAYMTRAIDVINQTATNLVANAKTYLDKANTTNGNDTDGIIAIKVALKLYDDLKTDHTNASLGNAQAFLGAETIADKKTYAEFAAELTEKLDQYNKDNADAIKALADSKNEDFEAAVATWNYKTTDFAALDTFKTDAKDAANAKNTLIQVANGTVRAKANKDEKSKFILDNYAIDASSVNDANNAAIDTLYTAAVNFNNAITHANGGKNDKVPNGLKDAGTNYEAAVVALANMIIVGDDNKITAADAITGETWTDEYIKGLVDAAYEEGQIDFTSTYLNKTAGVSKTTADARAALTNTLTDYNRAITVYGEQFVKNTDNTATDFNLAPEERAYTTPWADQKIIDAAAKIEKYIGEKLSAEQDAAEGIQKTKDGVSDAAKAAVDALMTDVDALYNKLSATDCKYSNADEIAADKAKYDELSAIPAVDRQKTEYSYTDTSVDPAETTNYYDAHYAAASGASKLAYIESALATWESAMSIVEEARAIDGQNVPVKDANGTWSIAKEAEFNAVKDKYDNLPVDMVGEEEVPGAEKANVNNVLGETYFEDQANTNDRVGFVINDYAQPITDMGAIDSVAKYNANKDALAGINELVDTVTKLSAATAGDVIDEVTVDQEDIDTAKAVLADIDKYFAAEKAALAEANAKAEVIAPAAEFDAAVDAITGNADTENIAKATKLIEDIRANEKAAQIIPYISKYAIYENYITENDKTKVDAFAALVKTAQDVEDSYADPKAADFKTAYDAAAAEYDKLTDTQKSKASIAYGQLTAAKELNDKYVAGNKAITDIVTAINTLQATYGSDGSALTTANYPAAKEESDAIANSLASLQKTYGDDALAAVSNQGAYKDTSDSITAFGNVADTAAKIDAIGTVTAESGAAIKAARDAFDALTPEQQKKVTNYILLVEAENAYNAIPEIQEAQKAADEVIAKIDAIGTVTADNAAEKQAAVEDARAAYDALTDLQKSLVDNVKALEDAEKVISENVIKAGDVNADGSVNALDIFAAIDHILGRTALEGAALTRADMNNDGSVDISDVLQIIKAWA